MPRQARPASSIRLFNQQCARIILQVHGRTTCKSSGKKCATAKITATGVLAGKAASGRLEGWWPYQREAQSGASRASTAYINETTPTFHVHYYLAYCYHACRDTFYASFSPDSPHLLQTSHSLATQAFTHGTGNPASGTCLRCRIEEFYPCGRIYCSQILYYVLS